jgi:hypothetical protein
MSGTASTEQKPRYLFFFSYARHDKDDYMERFFDDLHKEVMDRAVVTEAAARDMRVIKPGDDWPNTLVEALQNSQTLLCVYSPWYFNREFCGKEFFVFLRRQGVDLPDNGPVQGVNRIIPILWLGETDLATLDLPPTVLRSIQFAVPEQHEERYRDEGIQGMIRRGRRAAYRDIVRKLARQIIERSKPDLPRFPGPFQLRDVRNAFAQMGREASGGPNVLRLIYLAESDATLEAARPFTDAASPSLRTLMAEMAPLLRAQSVEQRLDPTAPSISQELSGAIRAATARNETVLVIQLPGASPADRQILQQAVDGGEWRGGVLTFSGETAVKPPPPSGAIGSEPVLVRSFSGSADEFRAALAALVCELQRRIVAVGPVQQQVSGEGPDRRPQLNGPAAPSGP